MRQEIDSKFVNVKKDNRMFPIHGYFLNALKSHEIRKPFSRPSQSDTFLTKNLNDSFP